MGLSCCPPNRVMGSTSSSRRLRSRSRKARSCTPPRRSPPSPCDTSPAEFVREAAINQLDEEVPYSVACEIEEFHEDRSPMYVPRGPCCTSSETVKSASSSGPVEPGSSRSAWRPAKPSSAWSMHQSISEGAPELAADRRVRHRHGTGRRPPPSASSDW